MTLTVQKPVVELVREKLEQIPTRFGRLLYLARSVEGSRYEHYGLLLSHAADEVHEALAKAHGREWLNWLSLSLPEQRDDVAAFLAGANRRQVLKQWSKAELWRTVVPPSTRSEEQELFVRDFRIVVDALQAKEKP